MEYMTLNSFTWLSHYYFNTLTWFSCFVFIFLLIFIRHLRLLTVKSSLIKSLGCPAPYFLGYKLPLCSINPYYLGSPAVSCFMAILIVNQLCWSVVGFEQVICPCVEALHYATMLCCLSVFISSCRCCVISHQHKKS